MRSVLFAFSLLVASLALAQPSIPKGVAAAKDKVVAVLRSGQYGQLTPMTSGGVTIYYCFPDRSHRFSQSAFKRALASSSKITWLPPMQGDGGMRPAVRMSLKELLSQLGSTDWRKAVKVSVGSSPQVTYRTLFVQDLKRKHRGVTFVELMKGDPATPETREFSTALILGFKRVGSGYKLTVIGFDHWKD